MHIPKFPLFPRAQRNLDSDLTAAIQSKGVQNELHVFFIPLQRALQRFLERLAMRSRIIAKLFNHHCGLVCPTGVVVIDRPLQTQGDITLQAKAQAYCNANHQQEPQAP